MSDIVDPKGGGIIRLVRVRWYHLTYWRMIIFTVLISFSALGISIFDRDGDTISSLGAFFYLFGRDFFILGMAVAAILRVMLIGVVPPRYFDPKTKRGYDEEDLPKP